MKSIPMFSMIAFVAILLISFSCQNDDSVGIPESKPMLKSGTGVITPNCDPTSFNLLIKQDLKAGTMKVSNNDDYLMVEIFPESNLIFSEIQLWVGTSLRKVPSGKNKLPLTEKFKYKSDGTDEMFFKIPLSEIYTLDPETACEAKKLFIFTHVVADIAETPETEKISVWSEGTILGNSKSVSYSTYTTCCQSTGGGGCFPHMAMGGDTNFNGEYLYNNISAGMQDIVADNSNVAGWVKWENGVLSFSFEQDWMLNDQPSQFPLIEITGYYELGGTPTPIETGMPSSNQGIFSVAISYYPYYRINLNLQNCYTGN